MRKSISVETNDPTHPRSSLLISGSVEKIYTLSQESVTLRGPAGSDIASIITIAPNEQYRFKITDAIMENGTHVGLTWNAYQAEDGPAYRIRVANLKKDKGRYSDTIHLKTDSDIQPEIRVRVYGNIQDPL